MGWNYVGEPFGSGVFPVKNSVEIPFLMFSTKNSKFPIQLQTTLTYRISKKKNQIISNANAYQYTSKNHDFD